MDESEPVTQIRVSIYTPLIYVGVLLSAFAIFRVLYRRNKISKLAKVEPLFGENHLLTLYMFLKDQYTNPDASNDQKPHEKVMKAALLRRAVEAIRRSLKLKENEPVFTKLYQDGLIGDEVFQNFSLQAKFQELELKEIVADVEQFKQGWSATFFPVAQEICFNEALRRRLNAMDDRSQSLSMLWGYYVEKSEGGLKEKVEEKQAIEGKKQDVEEKKQETVEEKTEEKK